MPSYAFVLSDVACSTCGRVGEDSVTAIAWGLCGPQDPTIGICYRLGDQLQWRSDFDSEPPSFTAFQGPVAMVNHGDPAILNLLLIDAQADPAGTECLGCGSVNVAVVDVVSGSLESVIAVGAGDERVRAALEADSQLARSYPTVAWRHGVSDAWLLKLDRFLDQFDLAPAIPQAPVDVPGLLERSRRIDLALVEGVHRFSKRLVCHAVARQINSDPYLMQVRVERLFIRGTRDTT